MQLLALPATAAEPADHKLSEWDLGKVMFGDRISKTALRGNVVVLEYWGVNCPPCIASLPDLAKLDKRYRDKGLRIIGAESQNSSKETIEPILEKAKVEYTITDGASGPIQVSGIPRAFVFGRDGQLIFDGSPHDADFERTITKAVREKSDEEEATTAPAGPLIPTRAWTNTDGKEIRAAVIKADSTSVTFKLSNGRDVVYPLEKLSQESQDTIAEAIKPAADSE